MNTIDAVSLTLVALLLDWCAVLIISISAMVILSGITFTFYPYIALRLLPEDIAATCLIGGMAGVLFGIVVTVLGGHLRALCGTRLSPDE